MGVAKEKGEAKPTSKARQKQRRTKKCELEIVSSGYREMEKGLHRPQQRAYMGYKATCARA